MTIHQDTTLMSRRHIVDNMVVSHLRDQDHGPRRHLQNISSSSSARARRHHLTLHRPGHHKMRRNSIYSHSRTLTAIRPATSIPLDHVYHLIQAITTNQQTSFLAP